jgi:8-oxo-dGTP diphosphatase
MLDLTTLAQDAGPPIYAGQVPLARRIRYLALRSFRALPPGVRRMLVRAGTTSYTVGCLAVVVRGRDVLLLEQPHHVGLSLPGGLLGRDETPSQCLRREVREELGVDLRCNVEPDAVVVDGQARRVDLVFLVRDEGLPFASASAEVQKVHWLPPSSAVPGSATADALRSVLGVDERP